MILEVAKYLKISIREVEYWHLGDICRIYASKLDEIEEEFYNHLKMEKEFKKDGTSRHR